MGVKCPQCGAENSDTSQFCSDCGTRLFSQKNIDVTKTAETPKKELTTGSTFANRYQIIEELGEGGMGRVYKAVDTKIKEKVALKLIKPEIAADKKTLERFGNELRIARKIVHKNVGRMYDINEQEGTHYISMEYVSGQNLKDFIRQSGQMGMGTAILIIKQICKGLSEAHKLGVVHRDLKPSNIMIDRDGSIRIMDFGIARSLKEKGITGAGVMIGTPEYMSPEQVEGRGVDQRSDIYSLGIIMYEMLTGQVPFEGETPFSIGIKHKSETPRDPGELNSQIPKDLGQVILKCLEKDPEKRYQSAGELRSELENIEKGIPTTEREIPKRKPLTSREITVTFGVKKLFIPALIVIAAIIIGIALWQFLPQKQAPLAPKIENSIAVISFENLTGDPQYDSLIKAVPSLFITKFEAMEFSYVVTLERLQDILKQMGRDPYRPIDTDTGFEVCRREGIEAMVVGKITKAGEVFVTDIKVLDVKTKNSLTSASSQGQGEDSIVLSQIDELSRRIAEDLGGSLSAKGVPAVSEITTSSLEAYEYYLKGNEADGKQHFAEAQKHFLKAVDIDPSFVMARLGVAHSYYQQGNVKARDEAMEKVKVYADRANPKEKLYIQAWNARYMEGDIEKTARIMKEITAKYPKEKEAHSWLGLYNRTRDHDEAIRYFQKVLELDPYKLGYLGEISVVYLRKGDFEKALEYANRYAAAAPNDPVPLGDFLAEIHLRMGHSDQAIEKCKKALSFKPDFSYALANIINACGLKEDYKEALEWTEEKIKRSSIPLNKADGYLLNAFYEYWTGAFHKVYEDAENARKLGEDIQSRVAPYWSFLLEGFAHLGEGDYTLARESFDRYGDFVIKV
ncbi:MAG: protein kinase, partial [Candidatus Aminicenantes bacterium]|nr:protein kinase [Candidatus Aminicenantes bacterium]